MTSLPDDPILKDRLRRRRRRLAIGWGVFSLILLMVVTSFPIYAGWINGVIDDPAQRGQFGDMFGTLNALFSGAAFAGTLYAIILQRQDLSQQMEEAVLVREEMRRTAAAQEEAQRALHRQNELAEQRERLETTLVLYRQWNAPDMRRKRTLLERYVNDEEHDGRAGHEDATPGDRDERDELLDYAHEVLTFLESATVLARHRIIDPGLFVQLVADHLADCVAKLQAVGRLEATLGRRANPEISRLAQEVERGLRELTQATQTA